MYQYNSIMSAVNDFIDEVNESDSEAKLVKPHTIKDAYELLAGYYGKETGAELLAEYESGRPHDVADATKLLLDVLKNKTPDIETIEKEILQVRWPRYYVIDERQTIKIFGRKEDDTGIYIDAEEGAKVVVYGSDRSLNPEAYGKRNAGIETFVVMNPYGSRSTIRYVNSNYLEITMNTRENSLVFNNNFSHGDVYKYYTDIYEADTRGKNGEKYCLCISASNFDIAYEIVKLVSSSINRSDTAYKRSLMYISADYIERVHGIPIDYEYPPLEA